MPTSIAIDSSNGTLYVAESIMQYENNNNSSSSIPLASSSSPSPSLSSPVSLISEEQQPLLLEPQMRIVKANISGNSINNNIVADQSSDTNSSGEINDDNDTTIVVDNVLNWPVIDMEVDDTSGLLYALHDHATISRINTTSGEREDILVTEEEEEEEEEEETATAVSTNEYEEELQDPLSVLINSSGQIVLSGKQDNYDNMDGEEEAEQEQAGNYDNNYSTVLYVPCINGDVDDYGRSCILSLPIDSNGNSAVVENIDGVTSPSLILENMTSRPIGIAVLNSSHLAASSSSSISEQQAQRPYALVSSETSPNSFGNNNNYTELLVIGSQPTNNNSISALSTIYHIKVSGSIPYLGIASNNNNLGSNSNQNPQLQQALPTTEVKSLVDYPDGQLGKVAVVSVPRVTSSSSSSVNDNESSETNPAASSGEDDDEDTSSSPPPQFGLNKTTAFIIDFGNNSSASSAALPQQLPKIIMLDVETGSVSPFLTLNSPAPNFMPIDIAFDYDNRALYVLSSSSNQEEHTDITNDTTSSNNLVNTDTRSNNSGLIWKISYQGPEQEEAAETSSNSSSISNGTDNGNNATSELTTPPPPPPPSSSNDTDSSSNSSDSDSGLDDLPPPPSYDEGPDDTDDGSIDTDDGSIDTDDGSIDTDDGDSGSSNGDTDDDNGDGGGNSSPPETTPPPPPSPDSSSPPSTEPVNNPPIAQVDVATTDQDTPVVIDVLANDVDSNGDSLIIDSVDEESIQGGNVRVISSGNTNDEDSVTDDDNNNSEANANERIEYTPAEGFIGSDEFTYTISDGNGAIDSATVTITVNQVVIAPHPISYWLEDENGSTQGLLERAAEEHDSDSDDEEQEEWSFNLGNFRLPVEFDVSDSENDTRGILEAGQGSNNDDEEEEEDDNSANVYDQLAAQLLAAKLNIENGVSTCEPIVTTIGYADTVIRDALYNGPGSTGNTTDESSSRDYASELLEILDTYNNNGCV
jgi:hypothetical protein